MPRPASKRLGPETLPALGLVILLTAVVLLALALDALGGNPSLVIFVMTVFLLSTLVVLLLRPKAMGLPRWFHRFFLRRYTMPGIDALRQSLTVSTLQDLPPQRAMVMLEVRDMFLDLLALRFGSPRRSPRALMALPQVEAFMRVQPSLREFLMTMERLAGDPEAYVDGWSGLSQLDFSNRLSRVIGEIREAFG